MRKRDALSKSAEYEKKGYELDKKFASSELSFSCAKFYSERKDKVTLLEVLQYMPEQEKRVKFMKEAELYLRMLLRTTFPMKSTAMRIVWLQPMGGTIMPSV